MKFMVLSLCVLVTFSSYGQNLVGNGGDVIASEFNSIARTAVYFLKQKTLTTNDHALVLDIQQKN